MKRWLDVNTINTFSWNDQVRQQEQPQPQQQQQQEQQQQHQQ